ncbi:MAG: nucleotidyltransferase domain-containing protein [Nitrospinae bacterium]|nr:nucleotidyltransferase domain-containing protein [Nitrospinota bacterium]
MKTPVNQIVQEYKLALEGILGGELLDVRLYGSQSRMDAHAASDIDVLLIMKHPFDYGALINRTSEATAAISLEHNVILSRVFATKADYEDRQLPFFMNARRESVAV